MAAYRSRLASLRENKQCDSVASCKTDLYILPLIQVPSVTTDIIYKDSQRLTVFTLQCRPSWSMCKRNSCINWYFQGLPGPSPPHCTSPPRGYSEPGTRGCPGPRHTGERPGPHPPFPLFHQAFLYRRRCSNSKQKFTSWVSCASFSWARSGWEGRG